MKKTLLSIIGILLASAMAFSQTVVSGSVKDTSGKPLENVGVSDGIQIVYTNASGEYTLSTQGKYGYVFIITPSGYVAESRDGLTPAFFKHLGGKTDFVLEPQDQDKYSMIVFTDVHLTNDPGKGDLYHFRNHTSPFLKSLSEELAAAGPVYSLQLGDLSHEVYWYLMDYNLKDAYNTLKSSGMKAPMYSVPGNHDNDGAVSTGDNTDFDAGHLYRKVLGPEYYSFNVGGDHYVMMDNIIYLNTPGEGKKSPGIKGKRNFYTGFTPDEMTFLKADLEAVPDDARVFLCTHAPLITGPQGTFWRNKEQMDTVASMFKRFRHFEAYSGHVHRQRWLRSERYGLDNIAICALSGNMWTTAPNKDLGEAGEDMGVIVGSYNRDTVTYAYRTRRYGENYLRVYDMNAVGEYYRTDPAVKAYFKKKSHAINYADSLYTNYVYINCWGMRPGYTLEVYENGSPLEVEQTTDEDPLYFVNHFIPRLAGPFFADGPKSHTCVHLYRAKASTADGVIAVWLKDDKGSVVQSRMMRRPIGFSPAMTSDGSAIKPDFPALGEECQVRLVQRLSSALVWEFSASGFQDLRADTERDWRIALYSDSDCRNLIQSWDLVRQQNNPNKSVFRGFDTDKNPPRFCFSGLEPSTRYWCKVTDLSNQAESAPVRGTTSDFKVFTIGKKGSARPGDMLLAENFSEITTGGWWLSGKYAVGNCPISAERTDKYQFRLGKKYSYDAQAPGYPIVDGRAAYYGQYQYALKPEMLSGTRLEKWGVIVIDNNGKRVDENQVYAHPGYLVCGTIAGKDGAGNRNAILLTPELSSLQKGKTATVKVTFRSQKYAASDADLKVFAGKVEGIHYWGNENSMAALDGEVTYDSENPQYISTPDITMGNANGYRTFTISGVTNSSRIFVGIRPDQTQGKKGGKFTHRRYCITDVSVELVSYDD